MKNIQIELQINDYKLATLGAFFDNKITFKDENENNTTTVIDILNNIITRDNSDLTIELNFNTKTAKYILKKENKVLTEKINILLLSKKNNKIEIKYQLEGTNFDFNIKYKEC